MWSGTVSLLPNSHQVTWPRNVHEVLHKKSSGHPQKPNDKAGLTMQIFHAEYLGHTKIVYKQFYKYVKILCNEYSKLTFQSIHSGSKKKSTMTA